MTVDVAPTFFSIKGNERSETYLDISVEYLWSRYVDLIESQHAQDVYHGIVSDMLDDIDVHHYPLDADF